MLLGMRQHSCFSQHKWNWKQAEHSVISSLLHNCSQIQFILQKRYTATALSRLLCCCPSHTNFCIDLPCLSARRKEKLHKEAWQLQNWRKLSVLTWISFRTQDIIKPQKQHCWDKVGSKLEPRVRLPNSNGLPLYCSWVLDQHSCRSR